MQRLILIISSILKNLSKLNYYPKKLIKTPKTMQMSQFTTYTIDSKPVEISSKSNFQLNWKIFTIEI